jgi:D-alanyl-lipoteichoic acid acyltransferase DltB (MBOAT superfamily)
MVFNSWLFIAFFLLVYGLYLLTLRQHKLQNAILLVASYTFYGWWDWRFLGLILASTLVDYFVGSAMPKCQTPRKRKALLLVSLTTNLGALGFFKYFNFFADSAQQMLEAFGMTANPITLQIILPVGISFYTFQTLSYTIDIYRGKMQPIDSTLDFALYVAFFPQLVAGPIERAKHFLPQIARRRTLTAHDIDAGLFLILWGFFKKVVVSDNLAIMVDAVFNGGEPVGGISLIGGSIAFAFQIYCDFSGYSDIARGLCKLMGFDLMVNFRLPYFAISPSDFWRRWHISLSTWLRDYLYIPLGGNRCSPVRNYTNLMITMLLGGLWHGASWTFVLWGAFHGLILVLYRFFAPNLDELPLWGTPERAVRTLSLMALMFCLTLIGWVLFRVESVPDLVALITAAIEQPTYGAYRFRELPAYVLPVVVMMVIQYRAHNLLVVTRWPGLIRTIVYAAILFAIALFAQRESSEFIYFQF